MDPILRKKLRRQIPPALGRQPAELSELGQLPPATAGGRCALREAMQHKGVGRCILWIACGD